MASAPAFAAKRKSCFLEAFLHESRLLIAANRYRINIEHIEMNAARFCLCKCLFKQQTDHFRSFPLSALCRIQQHEFQESIPALGIAGVHEKAAQRTVFFYNICSTAPFTRI